MNGAWVHLRPELEHRLDGALTRRLTTVVAAAGYGKTTLLEHWVEEVGGCAHRLRPGDRDPARLATAVVSALRLRIPDLPSELAMLGELPLGPDAQAEERNRAVALASAVTEAVAPRLANDLALVLDGIDEVMDSPGAVRFIETLVRAAPWRLHLVMASREPLPFLTARLRRHDEVLDLDATDLRLSREETQEWVAFRLGATGAPLADELHASTGGWPIAVHTAIEGYAAEDPSSWTPVASRQPPAAIEQLILSELTQLEPATRWLLQAATILPAITERVATRLDVPQGTLPALLARGLFFEPTSEGYTLTATSRHVITQHAPLHADEASMLVAEIAPWYVDQDQAGLALRAAVAAEQHAVTASLLTQHGDRLAERPGQVIEAWASLPPELAEQPALARVAGIAHQNRGDWERARHLLEGVADGAGFDATVAWRLGFIDHLRGDLEPALATYRRGMALGKPEAEAAICTAMAATVLWLQGDRDGCAALADDAVERATSLGDARALAASHTVLAMLAALDGDRRANDAHYLRALEHAERAADVTQQIRIRCNRASHHTEEGAHAEALVELDIASRLSELTGFAPLEALALSNRAETLIRIGRLEEAAVDAADAAARWRSLDSRLVGYGLVQLAHVQWLRGDAARARANLEEAVVESERAGDVQGLVPALAALSELTSADDPDQARTLAERALAHGEGMGGVAARLAGARAMIAQGQRLQARGMLEDASRLSMERRDRAGIAAATTLLAQLDGDRAGAERALELWREIGDPVGMARAELVMAGLEEPVAAIETVWRVRHRLHAIGCRALDEELDAIFAGEVPASSPRISIDTLGTFRVSRAGRPIPHRAWQSRKARDLLKVLISNRGRPVARDRLIAMLWPDAQDEAEPAGRKRLNVMVATLRTVLDPDRELDPDHFVHSDGTALRLDLDHVAVDVERFLAGARTAERLEQAGRTDEALARWRDAEELYAGDFCEADAYADWAVSLREQARVTYGQAASRIAIAEASAGRYEDAARYWLRLLERDPYDERGHLGLVRSLDLAGRRGDARRRYRVYLERMRELDLEPASYPAAAAT